MVTRATVPLKQRERKLRDLIAKFEHRDPDEVERACGDGEGIRHRAVGIVSLVLFEGWFGARTDRERLRTTATAKELARALTKAERQRAVDMTCERVERERTATQPRAVRPRSRG